MQVLNHVQMVAVSGGAIGLHDMLTLWAGAHHWNASKVIGCHALWGGISVTIELLPVSGPFALPLGMVLGGTLGALNGAIFYKIGSFFAPMDKESNPAPVPA